MRTDEKDNYTFSLLYVVGLLCSGIRTGDTQPARVREMALKYNKEMARFRLNRRKASHYTAKSYKGNFFPNFTASGTGLTVMPTEVTG